MISKEDHVENPKQLLAIGVYQRTEKIRGGGILYDLELMTQIESWIGDKLNISAPYIPTFLSLRNKPVLKPVIKHFLGRFDLILVEGAGIQHPAFCGLASELGVDFDVPTIGITKNPLLGGINWFDPLKEHTNEHELYPVYYDKRLLAYFIRKKKNKKGIFLSIGNKLSLKTAIEIVLPLMQHRIPEPLRQLKIILKEY